MKESYYNKIRELKEHYKEFDFHNFGYILFVYLKENARLVLKSTHCTDINFIKNNLEAILTNLKNRKN